MYAQATIALIILQPEFLNEESGLFAFLQRRTTGKMVTPCSFTSLTINKPIKLLSDISKNITGNVLGIEGIDNMIQPGLFIVVLSLSFDDYLSAIADIDTL